ncbi:hypothetical protein CHLV4139_09150 [Campylobacter helveticus]|uniref:hypothetical protein n=1 Tax=Campylobacter helveticus TaxID=28898 RepID=UPI00214C3D22|nr:hypothetical protein [Campylobacter helveticus]MCR2055645.1 hypothetical protein [Campylobacter helveticus]
MMSRFNGEIFAFCRASLAMRAFCPLCRVIAKTPAVRHCEGVKRVKQTTKPIISGARNKWGDALREFDTELG